MRDYAGFGDFVGGWARARALEEDTRRRLEALEAEIRSREGGYQRRAPVAPSQSPSTRDLVARDVPDEVSTPRSDRAEAAGKALGFLLIGAVVGFAAKEKIKELVKPDEP